jgi:NAD(P)-dependent dehydrogenase (short-subunit alcohol dehydrogenase family)
MAGERIALVTGAARGIGAACARALAGEGFQVAVHYGASREAAEKLASELPEAFAVGADLTDAAQVDGLVSGIAERTGRIDVLVNNAGIVRNAPTPMMKLKPSLCVERSRAARSVSMFRRTSPAFHFPAPSRT